MFSLRKVINSIAFANSVGPTFWDLSIQQCRQLGVLIECTHQFFLKICLHFPEASLLLLQLLLKTLHISLHLLMVCRQHCLKEAHSHDTTQKCIYFKRWKTILTSLSLREMFSLRRNAHSFLVSKLRHSASSNERRSCLTSCTRSLSFYIINQHMRHFEN